MTRHESCLVIPTRATPTVVIIMRVASSHAISRASLARRAMTSAPSSSATSSSPETRRGSAATPCRGKKKGFAELLNVRRREDAARDPSTWYNGREPLRPGTYAPRARVPKEISPLPPYANDGHLPAYDERTTQIQSTDADVEGMRAAGRLAARVLDMAEKMIVGGVTTTNDIDVAVHEMTIEHGAYPSPLNYGGFPKSVCTSLNECICHGIPDDTVIQNGDIINVDVTVYLNGYHGDTSRTIMVGEVTEEVRRLVETTERALDAAIAVCKPGMPVRKIGATIHKIADEAKFGVVDKFVGHGVGKLFHSGPTVRHHRNNDPGVLKLGQTFTIEPMLTIGSPKDRMWKDGWTSVTADGKWTARCEHTLLVTEDGVEILTASPYRASLAAGQDAA